MTLRGSIEVLQDLRTHNGLSIAAPAQSTGYNKVWIRDNLYTSLGLEIFNPSHVVKMMHKLLDIFLKHEYKIDHAIKQKPSAQYQYIHARYHPETLEEFWDEWGNKQNDAVGFFLFRLADLLDKSYPIIRNENDWRIVRKLVAYLDSIRYWEDKDNGVWEEKEEVHASSVGACLAGLKRINRYVKVPSHMIDYGQDALNKLLPRESQTKETDLALLSLIYPFGIVSEEIAKKILESVESRLVKERGLIRYENDQYYNKDGEAEWTMGFPWLAIIYKQMGNKSKFAHYMSKTLNSMNDKGELPELYYSKTAQHNHNTPLAWAQSLHLVALS
ncbi:MAG TPA: glycoside hydrolase family 15 protein [Candidatus Nanoarchaeia archaeon]|nr:glycoside hydrolase family 15 protein [Candidatus Nanoarchaeia archaeon]